MTTFIVEKEIEFDAGHRVPDHESKCFNPHGHRYRVVVGVSGPLQDKGAENGMVMDFSAIKKALTEHVHDPWDHGFLVASTDSGMIHSLEVLEEFLDRPIKLVVVDWIPTAENMAKAIFDILSPVLNRGKFFADRLIYNVVKVEYVKVYETPTSVAIYKD